MAQRISRHVQPVDGPEKAFGQALREIRKGCGLSQEELADRANFDRTYISLLERGVQSPTLRTILRLADALDTQASEMVRRAESILKPKNKEVIAAPLPGDRQKGRKRF